MYFETPFSDWSEVATLLGCLTIAIPTFLFAAMKALAVIQDKMKK